VGVAGVYAVVAGPRPRAPGDLSLRSV